MIVLFWCPSCRALHGPNEVVHTGGAEATMVSPRCARSGQPVVFRAVPDDPDDPRYGLPCCPTCRGEVRPSSRFCPQCGTPLHTGPLTAPDPNPPKPIGGTPVNPNEDSRPLAEHGAAQLLVQYARQRVRRRQVASILDLLADPPNYRRQPQAGDLPGDFDGWFDGGAVRYLTSITEFHFADGARASFHDLALRTIHIELPDGASVTIEEPPAHPNFADRVLAAVVTECQRILQSIQGEGMLPSAGSPPTQCLLVEAMASGGQQEWLYDLATNRLTPYAVGKLDMTREPVDGMYFQRGLIQYQVTDNQRTLEFSCTLGPRFGRGLRFELVDAPEGIRLEEPTPLWIS